MKKIVLIGCLSVGFFSFGQTNIEGHSLKLELRTNAKDQVITRIDNDKKDHIIDLNKDHRQDQHLNKLDKKHERPHFDKQKDNKDVDKVRDHRKENVQDRHEKHKEIIRERRNG